MRNNVIKRGTTQIEVEMLTEDFIQKYGQFITIYKDFQGYYLKDKDGEYWYIYASVIRNPYFVRIIKCITE